MKLPEIEEGPVQESSSSFAPLNAAQKQAAGVFEQGLTAMGQELVKSQNNKAAADLLTGLHTTQLDLRSKKTFTTQELRDALGPDYDSLPPEIKSQVTKTVVDESTGDSVTTDRDDIPSFMVAGAIYDNKARRLLSKASENFSSPGWAAQFQEHAQHEILAKKMQLSEHQLKDAHDYLLQQDTATAIDLANAGRFGEAKAVIDGSRTMDLSHKVQLQSHVDKIEQTRPLYEALRTGDIGTMAKQLPALGDDKQFTKLTPEERQSFTHRLEAEIKGFQDGISKAADQRMKATSEMGWNGIFEKERQGVLPSYSDIPMPGTVHATDQKEMIAYVDKLNKGERPETDMKLYAGLADLAQKDRPKFGTVNLLQYRNRLSDADFKHFVDLQVGLKGGNPEAFDNFQTTDEAINVQLMAPQYGIDVRMANKDNPKLAEKVGYVKTQVQHELALARELSGGKPLSLEERDTIISRTLKANIDPRQDEWMGMAKSSAVIIAKEAGVDAISAATFQRAVSDLDSGVMSGSDSDKKIEVMKKRYADYQALEPMIDASWKVQRGKEISASDSVRVWYWTQKNRTRLEGILRASGNFVQGDDALNNERITHLAVQEVLRKLGH